MVTVRWMLQYYWYLPNQTYVVTVWLLQYYWYKSNISGNSKVDVAVLLVLTKSNISGNSNVDVAVLQMKHKSQQ